MGTSEPIGGKSSQSRYFQSVQHPDAIGLGLRNRGNWRNLNPNDLQCIGSKTPVVFAESANIPNNAYVADLYESASFLGDLHRQIADTPDGAKVRLKVGQPPAEP